MWMLRIFIMALLSLALSQPVLAAGMNMRGTLVVISCSINNDQPLEVNFGDAVGVKKLDGIRYKQPLPVEIKCSRAPGDLLNLSFTGTASNFEPTALATQNTDLGIRLLMNDTPIKINHLLPIDETDMPQFHAVPVKRDGANLSSGKFSTMTTLAITLE